MSIDILKEDLKNSRIRSLYLFYGPEEYLKKYYLDIIEKSIIKDDFKVLNKQVLEGRQEIDKIISSCETVPVFSDKKLVVIKNSGLFKPKGKAEEGKKAKASNEPLAEYLKNLPEYACLVFYEEEIDKRIKIVEAVKNKGLVVEFPLQKPAELVKWVIKVFKSHKKEIDMNSASFLVDNCEQGMNEVLNEVNKVILYLGTREKAGMKDIEEVCTKSIKSRIFDLTDAIAERNSGRALKLLDDMINLKEPLPRVFFMITRQFRHILEMKLMRNDGVSMDEAASRIGITPYAAGKVSKQAGNFTIAMLKQAIEDSLEADTAVKTGRLDERVAAEMLITKFSSK